MTDIEILNVNVDLMATIFYDDGANEMALSSYKISKPVVSLISTPSAPTPSKSIATSSTSNPKVKVALELLKS